MILELTLGDKRLVVDTLKITTRKVISLTDGILDIRKKYLMASKFPPLVDDKGEQESMDAWQDRVREILISEGKKQDAESIEDYITRKNRPSTERIDQVKDFVELIAKLVDQSDKVTEDSLLDASYPAMKDFVKKVLDTVDMGDEFDA